MPQHLQHAALDVDSTVLNGLDKFHLNVERITYNQRRWGSGSVNYWRPKKKKGRSLPTGPSLRTTTQTRLATPSRSNVTVLQVAVRVKRFNFCRFVTFDHPLE